MDLKEIKQIVSLPLEDDVARMAILASIAKDPNAIKDVLDMLNSERNQSKELITDMNLELSRLHIYVDVFVEEAQIKKGVPGHKQKKFYMDKIAEFYLKYKGVVQHLYNRFN